MLNNINNFGKINANDNLYDDYKIEMKNTIHILNNHEDSVYCLCVLNIGRLVSDFCRNSIIIIYNKTTYEPDLIIKEHNNSINYIIQFSSGILASCSDDKTIKLFNIKGINYEILQTLNYHSHYVFNF